VNVVAIHYAPGQGEALVPALAEAMDKSLYEVRARVSSPEGGPAVVGNFGEIEPAWAFAGRLRVNGIQPILLTPEDVESDARRFLVRTFQLGGHGVTAVSRQGQTVELPYREVDLVLRGVRVDERVELKTTEERKFSATRALVTQGLITRKTIRKLQQVTTEERDDFLHLYSDSRPPLVFRASAITYQSLGPALQPSIAANFAYLVETLRQAASHAVYDDRLTNRQARARVLGPSLSENVDVAVSLLARVLRARR
jgi:hypothetical protein